MPQQEYTSVMDKTDWKRVIQDALDDACNSIGVGPEERFYGKVEIAISVMSCKYPNWDAHEDVKKKVAEIKSTYKMEKAKWMDADENRRFYAFPWNKGIVDYKFNNSMYLDILDSLKNLAGENRMLLYGRKVKKSESKEVEWTERGRRKNGAEAEEDEEE